MEAVAIANAQQHHMERTTASATALVVETSASEADAYQGTRPKDIYRVPTPIEQVAPQKQ